jgi:hypothetical protein
MPQRNRGRSGSLRRLNFPSNICFLAIKAGSVSIPIENIGMRGLPLPW